MCSVKFLDADVTRPLASVRAFVDEGYTAAFGTMQSYIEHVLTRQTILMGTLIEDDEPVVSSAEACKHAPASLNILCELSYHSSHSAPYCSILTCLLEFEFIHLVGPWLPLRTTAMLFTAHCDRKHDRFAAAVVSFVIFVRYPWIGVPSSSF